MRLFRHAPFGGSLAALLALLALLTRLAVPAGWMPAAEGMRLMPCPAAGPVMAASPHRHHGSKHDRKQGGDQSCPFAAFATAIAAPADTPPPGLPATEPTAISVLCMIARVGAGLAAPPPPPTGPPLSS